MRYLIIHNEEAGFGSDAVFEFERMLLDSGDEALLRVVGEGFQAEELLADVGSFDMVVASGGDGTISQILYALRYQGVPLCIYPSGTANLIAINIGAGFEPASIARACKQTITASLDVGEISWTDEANISHTEPLALMGGMGFDARLMRSALRTKPLLGEASYFAAVLENTKPEMANYTIEVDGVTHTHQGIGCLIANTAMIQGDIEIVPGCRMNDGLLDVIMLETEDAAQLLKPIFAGFLDRKGKALGRPHLISYRGKEIHVSSDALLFIETDGDAKESKTSAFSVRVLPQAVDVIVDTMSPYYPEKH